MLIRARRPFRRWLAAVSLGLALTACGNDDPPSPRATEATVRSGSYARMVEAHDAGAELTSVACPRLAPAISPRAAVAA